MPIPHILDRQKEIYNVLLNIKKNDVIHILIENQGRVMNRILPNDNKVSIISYYNKLLQFSIKYH